MSNTGRAMDGPDTAVDGNIAVFDGPSGDRVRDGGALGSGGLTKATGAEINAGTNDTHYVTPKAIADSYLSGIQFLDRVINSAALATLHSSPVELIAAPGGGLAIYPQSMWWLWVPGNVAFACAIQDFLLLYEGQTDPNHMWGSDAAANPNGFITNGTAGSEPINLDGSVSEYFGSTITSLGEYNGGSQPITDAENKALQLKLADSDPTVAGNGNLYLRIWYSIVPTVPFGT